MTHNDDSAGRPAELVTTKMLQLATRLEEEADRSDAWRSGLGRVRRVELSGEAGRQARVKEKRAVAGRIRELLDAGSTA